MIGLKIAQTGCDLPNATKDHHPEPPGQGAAILELSRDHIAVDVLARHIATQFVIGSVNAFTVERCTPQQSRN